MVGVFSKGNDFGSSMLSKFGELEKKSGIRLEVSQKILLAETGTLEQVLSILAGEPVRVEVVSQKESRGVITRRSTISTASGRILVKAQSKVFTRNIPSKVCQLVRSRENGIGSIMQKLEMSTFRRITEIGYDPASTNLFRRYKITVANKVGFEIREEFLK
jgi:chorismate-pyruvate lyase